MSDRLMGKGQREREKRRRAAEAAAHAEAALAPPDALSALLEVDTVDALAVLADRHPEVLGDEVRSWVEGMSQFEGNEPLFASLLSLLTAGVDEREAAFARFAEARTAAETAATELAGPTVEIEKRMTAGDYDGALTLIDEALAKAQAAGLSAAIGFMRMSRGKALFSTPSGDRQTNIEEAIEEFAAARPLVINGWQAADCLSHAGVAYLERTHGDPTQNIEQAIELFTEALDEPGLSGNRQLDSTVENNLAGAMLRRQYEDRLENLLEAERLCNSALSFRSPDRDPIDWAHTQVTLADTLFELSRLGQRQLEEALDAYRAVVGQESLIDRKWLVGAAHWGLGRCLRISAVGTPEEQADRRLAGDGGEPNRGLLIEARQHLERAYSLIEPAPDPLFGARVTSEYATALSLLKDEDAIALAREALAGLQPTTAPSDCVDAGHRLGYLLAEREEWEESAAAFTDAVEAAELVFHARLDTPFRRSDAARHGQLFRWAAFPMAMAGEMRAAALTLERGRTRELRRRLGLERGQAEQLDHLPADLADRYRREAASLIGASYNDESDPGRVMQEVLEEIRRQPGFESFGSSAEVGDLLAAIEDGWPVVYVNPTPYGTLILALSRSAEGELRETGVVLRSPNALEVFLRLMAGDAIEYPDDEDREIRSYFAAVMGLEDPERDPCPEFDEALPWLGEHVMKEVAELLNRLGARGVTLVPCGPIATAPLAACPWRSANRPECLLDRYEVRHAPSAVAAGVTLERARARSACEVSLVALADPTQDLDAAVPEVEEILRQLPEGATTTVAVKADATQAVLRRWAADATFLHLACHGATSLLEAGDAALLLADGPLTLDELTGLAPISARVAVVSACQTGVTSLVNEADEGLSIASGLVGIGAACAIASLWPVDDLATALLMSRLYHVIVREDRRPPEALRTAQAWLRQLSREDLDEFLDRHPAIRAEFLRRGGGTAGQPQSAAPEDRPYAHPYFWAGFVAVGA